MATQAAGQTLQPQQLCAAPAPLMEGGCGGPARGMLAASLGTAPVPHARPCVLGPRRRAALRARLDAAAAMIQVRCSPAASSCPAACCHAGGPTRGWPHVPAPPTSLLALSAVSAPWGVPGGGRGLPLPTCCCCSASRCSAQQVRLWWGLACGPGSRTPLRL